MAIKIVTVGDNVYLAEPLKFSDDGVTITGALPLGGGDVSKEDLARYLKHSNSESLEKDILVKGVTTFSERDLADDLADELTILEARFAKAKKTALPNLINSVFDNLR